MLRLTLEASFLALVLALQTPSAAAGSASTPALRADSLYRSATARLAGGVRENRALARAELEQAVKWAPLDTRYLLALGDLLLEGDFRDRARSCFERVTEIAPDRAHGHEGVGLVWKRDWMATLADTSLGLAVRFYSAAARAEPERSDAWLQLAPLLFERRDYAAATEAARRALQASPERAEARLAVAYLAYRGGRIERADSLFRSALPGLSPM